MSLAECSSPEGAQALRETRAAPRGVARFSCGAPSAVAFGLVDPVERRGALVAAGVVHAANRDAVTRAAELCEAWGHRVTSIPCPFPAQVIDDFLRYWGLVSWGQIANGDRGG